MALNRSALRETLGSRDAAQRRTGVNRDGIDDPSGAPPELGRKSIRQNGKLADRIDPHVAAQSASRTVIGLVVHHQAIHAIDVLVRTSP